MTFNFDFKPTHITFQSKYLPVGDFTIEKYAGYYCTYRQVIDSKDPRVKPEPMEERYGITRILDKLDKCFNFDGEFQSDGYRLASTAQSWIPSFSWGPIIVNMVVNITYKRHKDNNVVNYYCKSYDLCCKPEDEERMLQFCKEFLPYEYVHSRLVDDDDIHHTFTYNISI